MKPVVRAHRPVERRERLLASTLLLLTLWCGPAALSALEAAPAQIRSGRLLAPDASWHALDDLGLRSASATVALEAGFLVAGDTATAGGSRLALVRVDPSGAERLPLLPTRRPFVTEPLPLVSPEGRLSGAAWLEGSGTRRLEVRFAPWDGAGWGPAEEVAPPAAGSQLALAGTVLRDGSVLLVWSAFDGEDDEILWSHGQGVSWSPPRRLGADNAVPDITPALHAVGGSGDSGDEALAAWSRYQDGHYRVVASRFDGRAWSEPRPVGPAGSVFPGFEPGAETGAARILFRTAAPRGWQAVEVDRDGRPRRSARVAAETPDRPRLADDGAVLRFVWPGTWPSRSDEADGPLSPSVRSAPWENLP